MAQVFPGHDEANSGVGSRTIDGIPLATILVATVAGIALGTCYALSPVTVWFGVVSICFVAWAVDGLPERERQWVLGVLVVAIALRVLVVAALFLTRDPKQQYFVSFFFDGDGRAASLRSNWIRSFWLGGRVDAFEAHGAFDVTYGWSSYLYVLAYLQLLLGPAPYGIHLFNIALFVTGVIVSYRFVRVTYGRLPGFVGLALLLFVPTLFLWSISALKEELQFCLMAVTIICALRALQAQQWWRRLAAATVSALAVASLNTVRAGVLPLALAAIALGASGTAVVRRRYFLISAVVVLGVAGAYGLEHHVLLPRVMPQLEHAATLHIGNVRTEGHGYKTLDERFYSSAEAITLTEPEALRFILRSMLSFVFVPLPWSLTSRSELAYLPAQMIWYGTVALALAGVLPGLRRHALLTLTLAAYVLVGAAVVSFNNGNVGTLVRLRDLVTPFMLWLAALGAVSIFVRVTLGRVPDRCRDGRGTAPARPVVQSSTVLRWLQPFTNESWLCRGLAEFVGRRTAGVDAGIPRDEEAAALQQLTAITRRSRLFTVPAGWLASGLAAAQEAGVHRFVMRHAGTLSIAQRVRLLGWTIAVAVLIEALLVRAGETAVRPFGRGAQVVILALACLFMTTGRTVAAAWSNWRVSHT